MLGLSGIGDFDLVSLVLEGRGDALDEFVSRAAIPASLLVKLAVQFLERRGASVDDRAPFESPGAGLDLLAFMLEPEWRLLRAMPDGAEIKDWLRMAALDYARRRISPRRETETSAQADLPLSPPPYAAPPPRHELVLALLGDGCGAQSLALVMGLSVEAAATLAWEARRTASSASSGVPPCGVDEPRLSFLLDGALPRAEREELRRHAAGCPACGKRLRALRQVVRRQPSVLAAPESCPSSAVPFRYGRLPLPPRVRADFEAHAARCQACRDFLVFDRAYAPFAPPVDVDLSSSIHASRRRAISDARAPLPPLVGFGVNQELCRVLYTSGSRGVDLFASESRILFCEAARVEVQGISVQVKCLPESDEDDERCSIGAVFSGALERLPVFLEVEGQGEKQVTLREGAAQFRFVPPGCHALRFGRFKGMSVLVDVKPYRSRFEDLLRASDGLLRADEASGTSLEIALFYRNSDLVLRAAALRPGDPRALLRLLRAYFARPVLRLDGARLAAIGHSRAADRAAYIRFLAAGPIRAIAWVSSASSHSGLASSLRPLANVFAVRDSPEPARWLHALEALERSATEIDADIARFVRSMSDWVTEHGSSRGIREDLLARLGLKYVTGLLARYDVADGSS